MLVDDVMEQHHCRNCGIVVCGACSAQRVVIPGLDLQKPERVCTPCYNKLAAFYKLTPLAAQESPPQPLLTLPGAGAPVPVGGYASSEENSGAEASSEPSTPVGAQLQSFSMYLAPHKQGPCRQSTAWQQARVPIETRTTSEDIRLLAWRAKQQQQQAAAAAGAAGAAVEGEAEDEDKKDAEAAAAPAQPASTPTQTPAAATQMSFVRYYPGQKKSPGHPRDFLQRHKQAPEKLQQEQEEQKEEKQEHKEEKEQEEKEEHKSKESEGSEESEGLADDEGESEEEDEDEEEQLDSIEDVARLRELLRAKNATIRRLTRQCEALQQTAAAPNTQPSSSTATATSQTTSQTTVP